MDGSVLSWTKWRVAAAAVVLALVALSLPLTAGAAQAATVSRVDLRVLVVSNGSPSVEAIATQLDREGVPYTKVAANPTGRAAIDAAFLSDAATQRAKYQAVVLPNQAGGGLAAAEVAALKAYERLYGIRQVNAYDFPGADMGLQAPTYTGPVDGGTMTVTAPGKIGPFSYLDGTLPLDNFDTAVVESYGYLSQPVSPQPAGQTFTPLLTGRVGTASGVLAGVFAKDNREELVLTTSYNSGMQWWNEVASGVVTWMTRGVHLGYQRNYFAVHVDDVFLPDSRWSVTGNCTPGDNCVGQNISTTDIRMTAGDVDNLITWQNSNTFKLDMVYNGGGSDVWKQGLGLAAAAPDPLLDSFLAAQAQFPWINHTLTHPFLGCIQIAPTVVGQPWTCATDPQQAGRQDTAIDGTVQNGIAWASQAFLQQQIQENQAWGSTRFTDFDPAELVTGEHSGLKTAPNQTVDNPFLGPALTTAGVKYTASDNSREPDPRSVGSAVTVPRFPMNIFYNAGTYQDEVDEYNWIYTSRANGGGGICEANPGTSTCMTAALPAGNNTEARTSFESYILPIEVRNALSKITTNNPRPFYAHQSNLAEDAILYPVLAKILADYRAVYADNAQIVRTDMATQSKVLARQAAWKTEAPKTTAYIDGTGIHVPDSAADVPLTVPANTTGVTGVALEGYAGELSGWASGTATATPSTPMAGYVGTPAPVAPGAPTIGTATAGNASATVTWSAPASDGGSAVTRYRLTASSTSTTASAPTVVAPLGATSLVVTGLTNGAPYTFTVTAENGVGPGPASAPSNSVTPRAAAPSAPSITTVTAGNATATVKWNPPQTDGGANIANYIVSAYVGNGAQPLPTTVRKFGGEFAAVFTGLTNGTAYTFTVAAENSTGVGASSARSSAVTPMTVPDAPTITSVTGGNASATVNWSVPAWNGGSVVTGYRIDAYAGNATTPTSVTAGAAATSLKVSGLANGTSYTFRITATNGVGNGTTSGPSTAVIPAVPVTVPGAPTITSVTAGNASATVNWSVPASNGGAAVTGYRIDAYAGNVTTPTSVTAGAAATSLKVSGLANGTSYTFTVTATNSVGDGTTSGPSTAVIPAVPVTVPGAPTITSVTAGNASATVNWSVPASNGGAAVTGYRIDAYAGNATTPTSATVGATVTSFAVTGLTNGTSYTFTVTATNGVGNGTTSAPSNAVIPVATTTAPSAPAITSVTARSGAVALAWSTPTSDGGSPVTGYTIAVYQGNVTAALRTVDVQGAGTMTEVTGLTNGTSYSFTVTATNGVGSGPASGRSAAVAPTTVPDAPTIGQVIAGNASATVQWTASAATGGSPLTRVEVRAYAGSATTAAVILAAAPSATSTVVTGLTNGTNYTFTVLAVNPTGSSPESAKSASVTPSVAVALPGAPTIGTATAGDRRATVTWTAPAQTGASPITGYRVAVYSGSGTQPIRTVTAGATAVSLAVTGLTNGTAYTFTVAAVNALGTGPASGQSNSMTPAVLASAPRAVQATAGNGSVNLTWTAPAQNGGSPITGYVVAVRTGGRTVRTVPLQGAATSATVSRLSNGTTYRFTVAAVNAAGTGPASAVSNRVTPAAVPAVPTLGTVTPGNRSLTVTWKAPADRGGSAITGYVVSVYTGTSTQPVRTVRVGRNATATTLSALTNGTPYTVRVAAVNALGTGTASAPSVATKPGGVPNAPILRNATAGSATATVTWRAPRQNGGSAITGYVLSVYQGTGTQVLRTVTAPGTATSVTVTGLTSGTAHRFRVAAVNDVGTGPVSTRSAAVRPRA